MARVARVLAMVRVVEALREVEIAEKAEVLIVVVAAVDGLQIAKPTTCGLGGRWLMWLM